MIQLRLSPRTVLLAAIAMTLALPRLAAQTPSESARKITMVDVGGHLMRVQAAHLSERKAERPVVVLESGAVSLLENWIRSPRSRQWSHMTDVASANRI